MELTKEKLVKGIEAYCEYHNATPEKYFSEDYGDYDSWDAEGMLQFALFGELIFG
jgi:hypothetical protein